MNLAAEHGMRFEAHGWDERFAHHTFVRGDHNPLVASLLYGRPFGSNFDSKKVLMYVP